MVDFKKLLIDECTDGTTPVSRVFELVKQIHLQREEIITAFIAKYNCQPDECVQVQQNHDDGSVTWYVRKRNEKDGL